MTLLRQRILFLETAKEFEPSGIDLSDASDLSSVPAVVFLSYPFSDRSLLTVNRGFKENISIGSMVTMSNVLIGKVSSVYQDYSVFKTIFDPRWEMPVYIGPDLVRGLLQGGIDPKISLIGKKNTINIGDVVVTADPSLTQGRAWALGRIDKVFGDEQSSFWEASLDIPYSLNEIRHVSIIIDN